jgi:integrase
MPKLSSLEFNQHTARTAKPKERRYELRERDRHEEGITPLILRVEPTGRKTWRVELAKNVKRNVGDAAVITLGQARTKAAKMKTAFSEGKKIEPKRSVCPNLKRFIDKQYREHARANYKTPELGDQVANRILKALEADPPILRKKINKLSNLDIERWKRKRGELVAKSTLKRDLGAISTALNLAVRTHRFMDENPARGVTVKVEDDKRVRFLSDDERKSLLQALEDRDREFYKARAHNADNRRKRGLPALPEGEFKDYLTPLTILVMNTGLRRSEALGLTWENVQLEGDPRLTVRAAMAKSSKTRHVPLNEIAVDILKRWRKQNGSTDYVFVHRATGAKLNKAHRAWKKLMADAGIDDFRFHDLRHDFASQLVMKGTPLYLVKELLGHGSIEMTERYAHLADDALAKAVEVLA